MSDQAVKRDAKRTEALLRSAAASASWPPTPELRGPVLARIEASTPDLRGPVLARIGGPVPPPVAPSVSASPAVARRGPARRRLLGALALALVGVVALAGVATGLGYRLPGLDIFFVERLPPAGSGLGLGSPVPVGDALALGRGRVLLPAALPRPDSAYVLGAGDRRIVTLAWRAAEGAPTLAGSDLSLTLMAVAGSTDGDFLGKAIGPGTTIEPVTVGGERGWWISGAPHELLFMRPGGEAGVLPAVLVGDTLVFARDGTLYRLESTLGREATLAIAESMR